MCCFRHVSAACLLSAGSMCVSYECIDFMSVIACSPVFMLWTSAAADLQ